MIHHIRTYHYVTILSSKKSYESTISIAINFQILADVSTCQQKTKVQSHNLKPLFTSYYVGETSCQVSS